VTHVEMQVERIARVLSTLAVDNLTTQSEVPKTEFHRGDALTRVTRDYLRSELGSVGRAKGWHSKPALVSEQQWRLLGRVGRSPKDEQVKAQYFRLVKMRTTRLRHHLQGLTLSLDTVCYAAYL